MQIQFHPDAGEIFQQTVNKLSGFTATITTHSESFDALIIRAGDPHYESVVVRRFLDDKMERMDNAKTVSAVNILIH